MNAFYLWSKSLCSPLKIRINYIESRIDNEVLYVYIIFAVGARNI